MARMPGLGPGGRRFEPCLPDSSFRIIIPYLFINMAEIGAFDFYCEEALSGKTKVQVVYESAYVLAFHHTKPTYEKHIVVIPKKHIHDLSQVSDADLVIVNEILKVARDILKTIDFKKSGARVITNLGVFQDTPHLHFHVIAGKKLS